MMEEALYEVPKGYILGKSSSNKFLQILLHFNFYAGLAFFAVELYVLIEKEQTYQVVIVSRVFAPVTFAVWSLCEAFRLWFGYIGNLQEKLPQLSVFALLTIFPQLPCLIYLAYLQQLQLPFEIVMSSILIAFAMFELLFVYISLRRLIQKQTQSYMKLVNDDDELAPIEPSKYQELKSM